MTKATFQELCDFESRYKKEFSKCNMTAGILYDLQERFIIIEEFSKFEGKKLIEHYIEEITAYNLACIISGVSFFADRMYKTYTPVGCVATRFIAKNPHHKETRIIRSLYFLRKENYHG